MRRMEEGVGEEGEVEKAEEEEQEEEVRKMERFELGGRVGSRDKGGGGRMGGRPRNARPSR